MARKVRRFASKSGTSGISDSGNEGAVVGTGDTEFDGNPAILDGVIIDPGSIDDSDGTGAGSSGADSAGSSSGKRRGRKPGVKSSKGKSSLDISGIEMLLYSTHGILASLTKTPELELDNSEAEKLSKAIGAVAQFYDFEATEKTLAWTNLTTCVAMIYGPRIFAISMRRRNSEKKQESATVYSFNPAGA